MSTFFSHVLAASAILSCTAAIVCAVSSETKFGVNARLLELEGLVDNHGKTLMRLLAAIGTLSERVTNLNERVSERKRQ